MARPSAAHRHGHYARPGGRYDGLRLKFGDGQVLGEDLRDLYVRAWPLPGRGLFEQTSEDDPRLLLGLGGPPVPELSAGQRVDPEYTLMRQDPLGRRSK